MIGGSFNDALKTTSYKVVLPFYIYAALSFLAATILLLISTPAFLGHYFTPQILAVTHSMTLGWGTMMILGASHQLVPVLIENKLHSDDMGYVSFALAAIGIPFLVYGFYHFDWGWQTQWGAVLIILSIIIYIINLILSMKNSKKDNVHAVFVITAAFWLLTTILLGLTLVYNFHPMFLGKDSIYFLPLHANLGLIGWFLLIVIGVGSRLIPMFLISKYKNVKLLWWIYSLVNGSILVYILDFFFLDTVRTLFLPWLLLVIAISLFGKFCYAAYKERIRRQVDDPMKISLFAVFLMMVPLILSFIGIILVLVFAKENISISLSYGFLILFGWVTAIILGMTFKTMPFIVWNKVYKNMAGKGKTPTPKDLFSTPLVQSTGITYTAGLIVFVAGCLASISWLLQIGAILLLAAAIQYVINVFILVTHKSQIA